MNVLCVQTVRPFWRVRNLRLDRTNPIAPAVSVSCSPSDVQRAVNPSRGRVEPDLSLSKAVIGTPNASCVLCAKSPWPAKASSQMARTSFALSVPKIS